MITIGLINATIRSNAVVLVGKEKHNIMDLDLGMRRAGGEKREI